MKKIIGIAIFLLCVFNTTQGSILQLGPRVGISTLQMSLDDSSLKKYYPELGFGYQIGAVGRITFPIIYIQPELLFAYATTKYYENSQHTLRYMKLDLPIMIGKKFLEIFRAQAGPIFSLLLSAIDDQQDVYVKYTSITTGCQLGMGVDIFDWIIIDLKYERSLSKFGTQLGTTSINHGQSVWIISVGMNLL